MTEPPKDTGQKSKWSHLWHPESDSTPEQPDHPAAPLTLQGKFPDLFEASTDYLVVVDVPDFLYLQIPGSGDPRKGKDYRRAVEAAYEISLGINILPSKGAQIQGFYQYEVPPLEAHFSMASEFFYIDKPEQWQWWVGIIQPGFVNEKLVAQVAAAHELQRHNPALQAAKLGWVSGGRAAQMLHVGPAENVPQTYEKLRGLMKAKNLTATNGFSEVYTERQGPVPQTIIRQRMAGTQVAAQVSPK